MQQRTRQVGSDDKLDSEITEVVREDPLRQLAPPGMKQQRLGSFGDIVPSQTLRRSSASDPPE